MHKTHGRLSPGLLENKLINFHRLCDDTIIEYNKVSIDCINYEHYKAMYLYTRLWWFHYDG